MEDVRALHDLGWSVAAGEWGTVTEYDDADGTVTVAFNAASETVSGLRINEDVA